MQFTTAPFREHSNPLRQTTSDDERDIKAKLVPRHPTIPSFKNFSHSHTNKMTEQPTSLTTWTEQHILAIFDAKTEDDFDKAFDAFVSQHATITLNGKRISRDAYKKHLQGENSGEVAPAVFNVVGAVEVPSNERNPAAVGPLPQWP